MKVERVSLAGVGRHQDTTLDLPRTGVVLVTGVNGSGKTSIIEAVPLALWGKTLRDDVLWSTPRSQVSVVVDGVEYTRTNYGRVKLRYGEHVFESTTAAQKSLEDALGSMAHWRKACVLSFRNAVTFTGATDAERKRHLESLTGLDRLDEAHTVALQVHGTAKSRVVAARQKVGILLERVKGAMRAVEATASVAVVEEVPAPDLERLAELRQEEKKIDQDVRAYQREAANRSTQLAKLAAAVAAAKREGERLDRDECPTCGQAISVQLREAARARVEEAEQEVETAKANVTEGPTYDELVVVQGRIRREIVQIERMESMWSASMQAREHAERAKVQHEHNVKYLHESQSALLTAQQEYLDADLDEREAGAVVKVLSTKGVRAHLLANTISAVETCANMWLAKICDERLKLTLKPYTETDGVVKESVSLSIAFDSEDRGYKSASDGELRRIDIALCFALAEVADASMRGDGSTVFIDEIVDSLDAEGRQRVVMAISELAQDRCVVVISHVAVEEIRPLAVAHWHVEDGRVAQG